MNNIIYQYNIIAKLKVVDKKMLSSLDLIRPFFESCVEESSFHVIKKDFHQFSPGGVTGYFLIARSHISFHSWPEHNILFLHVATSYGSKQANDFVKTVIKKLNAEVLSLEHKQL
jgi:S-adenosylmethionine decarboxylase